MRPRGSILLVPWFAYVAVTVAGPALNGAWRRDDFAGHAWLTLGASTILILGWSALARLGRRMRSMLRR